MKRKKQNLDGLSLPINSFVVVVQLLSILGLMAAFLPCLHFIANIVLWSSITVFGVSAVLLFMFKGFPLFVFYGRFLLGFSLVCIALVQATSIDQFQLFLSYASDGVRIPSNPISLLHSNASAIAICLVAIEFVAGVALLIGASIRYASVFVLLVLAIYALASWNLVHFQATAIDESAPETLWNFKLDSYLAKELNDMFCFVFACCMAYIAALGIVFGQKIYPNSVKLNWYLLPILSILAAGFSILLHWYTPLFFIPLTLMVCLLVYRSGGRLLANHFGALAVALICMVCFLQFQKPLGIEMKRAQQLKSHKK